MSNQISYNFPQIQLSPTNSQKKSDKNNSESQYSFSTEMSTNAKTSTSLDDLNSWNIQGLQQIQKNISMPNSNNNSILLLSPSPLKKYNSIQTSQFGFIMEDEENLPPVETQINNNNQNIKTQNSNDNQPQNQGQMQNFGISLMEIEIDQKQQEQNQQNNPYDKITKWLDNQGIQMVSPDPQSNYYEQKKEQVVIQRIGLINKQIAKRKESMKNNQIESNENQNQQKSEQQMSRKGSLKLITNNKLFSSRKLSKFSIDLTLYKQSQDVDQKTH